MPSVFRPRIWYSVLAKALSVCSRTEATMTEGEPSNDQGAHILEEIVDLLEIGEVNGFRIRTHRSAANTVRSVDELIAKLTLEGGWVARGREDECADHYRREGEG